ncbi:MAG: hypothetical protein JWM11_6854 [Planctomycetaceae bacterium]|nr:hypothetical protein [Planctomycetaceae bacterium]
MFNSNDLMLSRREWLRLSAVGALSVPVSGWLDVLAAHAAERSTSKPKAKHKSCILLFMEGGPSHIDTFDPKPENKTSEIKPISTSIAGVQISEYLPKLATQMQDMALLRGMSTSEGSHGRARYYMHTGYRSGAGGVVHPSIGAVASSFLGSETDELPNFVSIGGRAYGSGYAGPFHAPIEVGNPEKGIENLSVPDTLPAFDKRVRLLDEMEKNFVDRMQIASVDAHRATYQRATALMHSPKSKAFDISKEPDALRDAYGRNGFGDGCLLARRLVEQGVSFVEVQLGKWDTHVGNGKRVQSLSEQVDPAMSTLITDLKQRGLLDSTLVIWMGEFGRTPTVGKRGGRDHYPRAWTSVMAGGGLKLGQAIGRTDKQGGTVEEGKVTAVDFMATVCKALEIDYTKEFHTAAGRPMRVVDKGEKVVSELF